MTKFTVFPTFCLLCDMLSRLYHRQGTAYFITFAAEFSAECEAEMATVPTISISDSRILAV
jgi:hypothetical protein